MKQEMDPSASAPAKIFIKLTLFGFVLIGFAYVSLLLLGNALQALH